ncbi:MAG: xanthine dehydrogenase family protein molybdopterin-binding subunit, partial [Candidatus Bathyarchaeia archaeon]
MKETYEVIGRSVPKKDGINKVLGHAQFLDDLELPGLLHAKLLRSRYAHARILNVDTSAAETIRGVRAVITAWDVPVNVSGVLLKDQPILASDRVRYLGDPIAAVAADTLEQAEEAVESIRVDYEELPAVFDAEEAMKLDAVRVHDGPNVCSHRKIRLGDVEKGFRESDIIVEDAFSTQKIEQCPLEPQGAMATVDVEGKLTVWSPVQSIPMVLNELARVLQRPTSKIRLMQTAVGGGFGARIELALESYAALLALKTRRPVKILRTREDEFTASSIRHSYRIDLKSGVKNDGRVTAREVRMVADTGAYMSFGDMQLTKAAIHARGPYNIPNVKVDGYLVYTNNTVAGAMRGIGVVQAIAAEEAHMDHIARRLETDPIELRLKNALKAGDITATGQILHSVGLTETILNTASKAGWRTPTQQPLTFDAGSRIRYGRGVASMQYPIGATAVPNPSSAFLKVSGDGSVTVVSGALDLGQGVSTVLSQIVAEELGVSVDRVTVVSGNSDIVPYDTVTGASRTTYTAGNAVRLAAKKVKEILFNIAAQKLSVSPEALEARGGVIQVKHAPQKYVT